MWITIKIRKTYVLFAAVLLFFLITGIILFIKRPNEVILTSVLESSSPILIIDAGHGGADGGAVALDGSKESIINLQIAERIYAVSGFLGINSVMTRRSEELSYPSDRDSISKMKRWDQQRRLELINSMQSVVFISIHQNKYPDPMPSGPQVLYGKNEISKCLGEGCHELMNQILCPENRRLAMPASDDIYLLKNAQCPAILVECGFLSNKNDLKQLKDDDYQKKIAAVIIKAYLDYSENQLGGTNERENKVLLY